VKHISWNNKEEMQSLCLVVCVDRTTEE